MITEADMRAVQALCVNAKRRDACDGMHVAIMPASLAELFREDRVRFPRLMVASRGGRGWYRLRKAAKRYRRVAASMEPGAPSRRDAARCSCDDVDCWVCGPRLRGELSP